MVADFASLVPFVGLQGPGFHFTSGDYLHLVDWEKTPGDIGPYRCVWHFDADDVRTLYVDPKAAGPVVCAFHDFQRVVGAEIRFEWPDPLRLKVVMQADDETRLEMDVRLANTVGTRLLERLSAGMPSDRYPSAPVQAVGDTLVRWLLTRGAGSIGKTETGRTFNFTQTDRLLAVREASVEWKGAKLELAARPIRDVYFGEELAAPRPYLYLGTALLERGPEMGGGLG
jgi:hypothetical protein